MENLENLSILFHHEHQHTQFSKKLKSKKVDDDISLVQQT